MSEIRVLCFGKEGLLSTELQQWLPELAPKELVFLSKDDCDITSKEAVLGAVKKYVPTIIINAAAYTKVDQCEDEATLATQVNGDALNYIVSAANQVNATLLHFSTDYVFDGEKIGPYEESDITNPLNAYGKSKLIGEQHIIEKCKQYYIIRIQWVFGQAKRNFIDTMLDLAKNTSEIKVVNDQIGSPTSTTTICKGIVNLLHNTPDFGVYHFRTLNHCSWYDYACYIFKTQGIDITVIPVSSSEFKQQAKRPKNSILNIAKWIYADLYTPLNWQRDVDAYFDAKLTGKNT